VALWGVTDFPQNPDHHVVIDVNGVELADEWFDGLVDRPVALEVPDSILAPSGNTLRLLLPHDTGADYDLVHYDGYRVTYPRAFVARDGRLSFTARGRAFTVEGLPSAEVVVYREVDGELHHLANPSVTGQPGSYSATFVGWRLREEATYHVSTVDRLESAAATPAVAPEDITSGPADLVVIAHPDFRDGLEPLVAARRSQGYSVLVADVDQIYSQFSHGVFGPQAIRDYLAHAHAEMGTRFALLVGGDTYDYLDHLGLGAVSFIPSLYARTDDIVHFAPVDPLFGDLDSDGSPEIAIGRLPVRTVEELEWVIDKTLRYDDVSYRGTAILAADAYDLTAGYSFSEASDEMAALLPGDWRLDRAYLDEMSLEDARLRLVDSMEAGAAVTSYFGHSGPTVWSFDRLFDTDDALELDNGGLPTVVTQWGCWNTYHVSPAYETLGHVLLLGEDRGAAAVLGAATLTQASSEKKLGREVFARLGESGKPIGEAVLEAKRALAEREPHLLDVLWGWTLLGDPTLAVEP
jgi:hypothetical protein